MQLLISQSSNLTGFAFPDNCGFIFAPGFDVAVEAVVSQIDLATDKPLGPRTIPLQNFVPFPEPVQLTGDASPEFFGFLDGFFVDALILFQALDVRLLTEFRRAFESALLLQGGIDVGAL